MKRTAVVLCGLVPCLVLAVPGQAQTMYHEGLGGHLTGFGRAVAVSGNTVVVGEPRNQTTPGMVYVYGKGARGWSESAHFSARGGVPGDGFGAALAVEGNTVVVGAPESDSTRGVVYVFTLSRAGRWEQSARLTADGGTSGDNLGSALALSGDVLHGGGAGAGFRCRGGVPVSARGRRRMVGGGNAGARRRHQGRPLRFLAGARSRHGPGRRAAAGRSGGRGLRLPAGPGRLEAGRQAQGPPAGTEQLVRA